MFRIKLLGFSGSLFLGGSVLFTGLFVSGCGSKLLGGSAPASGSSNAGPPASVYQENQNPGTTDWQITNPAKGQIEGFPSSYTVPSGGSVNFMVRTSSTQFKIQIFRLGWYGGLGGRSMTTATLVNATAQPTPLVDASTGLTECPWKSSYTLQIPTNWVSGIYLAKLTTADTNLEQYIPFVVTYPSSTSDIVYDVPIFNDEAYNSWGGKSLYSAAPSYKVSLLRPFDTDSGAALIMDFDIDDIRFLEKHGYDVTYETDMDLHQDTIDLTKHKAWIVMAHPEYWTRAMRDTVTKARDAGVNLGFFSGDEMGWQVRLESSPLTGTPNSTIVCYRLASLDPDAQNPSTANLTTVVWWQPPLNEPADWVLGTSLEGVMKVNTAADLVVGDATSWVFAGTGLSTGAHVANFLAGEVDRHKSGFGPRNAVVVAHSPVVLVNGHQTFADMTWYNVPSGAIVFEAGTFHFGWGLEPYYSYHTFNSAAADAAVQQIATNVLEKFGAHPAN